MRAALHYFALVVLPILGVALVMSIGEKLSPPPDISGEWRLNANLTANSSTPCARQLGGFVRPVIQITQSGLFVNVRLPNAAKSEVSGRLAGNRLVAEDPPALFGSHVFDLLRLSAQVENKGTVTSIHGVLAMPRHVDCVPIPFVAVRSLARNPLVP